MTQAGEEELTPDVVFRLRHLTHPVVTQAVLVLQLETLSLVCLWLKTMLFLFDCGVFLEVGVKSHRSWPQG